MSVLERVIIDKAFLKKYLEVIDVCDYTYGPITLLYTGEQVSTLDYPYLYALRESNYNDNFTREEMNIIKKKVKKEYEKMLISEKIVELQKKLNELN